MYIQASVRLFMSVLAMFRDGEIKVSGRAGKFSGWCIPIV